MTSPEVEKQPLIGTPAYDNWRAFVRGEPLLATAEFFLYSDAWLTGEVIAGLEPYYFFNMLPIGRPPGEVGPTITLRMDVHVDFETPEMEKTDQSRYHGGWMADELAALASLKCGVRLRAGEQSRRFEIDGDPQGRPMALRSRPEPRLSLGIRGRVLSGAFGTHSVAPIERIESFPTLCPEQAIALVRAARLYQDALWLAESEPNLSWLMLVAAVETSANCWRAANDTPLERLAEARPDFVKSLEATGIEGLPASVADEFADCIGATKKFVDFLLAHAPPPPENRPDESCQLDWSPDNLRKAFRRVYACRSKALHDGMPFPAPMCDPPFPATEDTPAERPIGAGASVGGGAWVAKDIPMHLHVFEYVARSAIDAWWQSMAESANKALQTDAAQTEVD